MAGLYQTLITWNSNDVLYAEDVDNEFQNVRNNMIATSVEGYSTINNVFSQTRAVAEIDPAPGGVYANCVDNQTMAGEIEKLRFVIHRIIDGGQSGTTYGTIPARSLSSSSEYPLNWYFPFNGQGTLFPWVDSIKRGGIINSQTGSAADFVQADIDTNSSHAKFGQVSMVGGGILGVDAYKGSQDEGTISAWFRNFAAGDYIVSNPTLGVSLYCATGTGFLTAQLRLAAAASNSAKTIKTVTSSGSQIGISSYNNAIIRWGLNGVYGSGQDSLQLLLNGLTTGIGTQLTAQTFGTNYSNSGNWFIGSKENIPSWTSYDAMNVLPDSNGWTKSSGSLVPTVSGGVLNAPTGTAFAVYTKTSSSALAGVNLDSMTVDLKVNVQSGGLLQFTVRDNSLSRGVTCLIRSSTITLGSDSNGFGNLNINFSDSPFAQAVNHDFTNWTWVRVVFTGGANPVASVYIDGVFGTSLILSTVDSVSSNNTISFSVIPSNTSGSSVNLEWFAYVSSAANPFLGNASSGNLDDIGCFQKLISDSDLLLTVANSTNNLSFVLGSDSYLGVKSSKSVSFGALQAATGTYGQVTPVVPQSLFVVSDGTSKVPVSMNTIGQGVTGQSVILSIQPEIDAATFVNLGEFGCSSTATPIAGSILTTKTNSAFSTSLNLSPGVHAFTCGAVTNGATGASAGNVVAQYISDMRE